jgi:hypothetical protein
MISLDTEKTIAGLVVLELYTCPIGKRADGTYIEHEEIAGTISHTDGEIHSACWNRETGRTTWDGRWSLKPETHPYPLDLA